MLQADKQVLLAGVKRNALELRQRELEFNVERFTNLATQASVIAGFSFESLVELEVPEDTHWFLSSAYFVFGALAMALSLYVLCVASFACVYGHRLALQGPHGSLERAVHMLKEYRFHFFATAGASLLCLVFAAILMSWIKMGAAASVVTTIFLTFFAAVASRLSAMHQRFEIPGAQVVTGAARIQGAGAAIDLAPLNPRANASDAKYQPMTEEEEEDASDAGVEPQGRMSLPDRWIDSASRYFGGKGKGGESARANYEGPLMKKGGKGLFSAEYRSRYFVLVGPKLYYFNSWEDYGSMGLNAATNYNQPILMSSYQATPVRGDPYKFDLIAIDNPLERTWELQAGSVQEAKEWLEILKQARDSELVRRQREVVCTPQGSPATEPAGPRSPGQ